MDLQSNRYIYKQKLLLTSLLKNNALFLSHINFKLSNLLLLLHFFQLEAHLFNFLLLHLHRSCRSACSVFQQLEHLQSEGWSSDTSI